LLQPSAEVRVVTEDPRELSKKLGALRKERGISMREASRTAGLSVAALSAIEKGQSSPTLATLHKVLKALGTDFAGFFVGTEDPSPVFRANAMKTVEGKHRTCIFLLPGRQDLRFQMLHETIATTETESECEWERHDFDLGGVILNGGPVRLEIEGEGAWTLSNGDAFYIKTGVRHRAINLGRRDLELVTVADPPRY
jgi:transcriptional regulator with XRE-family HTH domain